MPQRVHFDTHTFAEEAVRRGAVAVVCERELPLPIAQIIVVDGRESMATMASCFYGNPSKRLKVIGITGTNGKTTVSYSVFKYSIASGLITRNPMALIPLKKLSEIAVERT